MTRDFDPLPHDPDDLIVVVVSRYGTTVDWDFDEGTLTCSHGVSVSDGLEDYDWENCGNCDFGAIPEDIVNGWEDICEDCGDEAVERHVLLPLELNSLSEPDS